MYMSSYLRFLPLIQTSDVAYPLAVSPDSMTQSAPSSTALATSLASALQQRQVIQNGSKNKNQKEKRC